MRLPGSLSRNNTKRVSERYSHNNGARKCTNHAYARKSCSHSFSHTVILVEIWVGLAKKKHQYCYNQQEEHRRNTKSYARRYKLWDCSHGRKDRIQRTQ